ncbi:MAG: Uma2 family endonuclease [Bacteroidetes bacterium]|nr:MAG: Uma2 family endonuclease [Bacteroidota bacterium]
MILNQRKKMQILEINLELVEKLPADEESRLLLPENVACKASLTDYLALNEICEYRIEYHEGFIFSFYHNIYNDFMTNHEKIVSNFMAVLILFIAKFDLQWQILPSNMKIYIHNSGKPCVYKPDAVVFKDEVDEIYFEKKKKNYSAANNPYSVLEVLSKSTKSFDWNTKLANYQKIETLEQIIFVEQYKMAVYVYDKIDGNWIKSEYFDANDQFFVMDCVLSLEKLYHRVKF